MNARDPEVEDSPRAPFGAGPTWVGALVLALFALWFLRGALADIEGGVLSAADVSQAFPILAVDEGVEPANPALLHAWATDEAWRALVSERLLHTVLPTWNGLVGGGVPLLANPRTAVLSPFTWPHVVLPPAWAALLSALARLFVAGFATFLFLRELRAGFAAALVGALVFQFSGSTATTLLESYSATLVVLPLGLWLVERLVRTTERALRGEEDAPLLRRARVRTAVALALVLAFSFFGGAVDAFVFGLAVILAWAGTRFVGLARAARGSSHAVRALRAGLASLTFALVAAAFASALQWLPYLEFLRAAREARGIALDGALPPWPLAFFPGLFGLPSGPVWAGADLPRPGWSVSIAIAVGALPLVLAVFGFSATRRSTVAWFFALVGLAGAVLGFGFVGFGHLQGLFPGETTPVVTRALVLVPFAIAVGVCLAVDHVARGRLEASLGGALCIFAAGAAIVLVARSAAERLLERLAADPAVDCDRLSLAVHGSAHVETLAAAAVLGLAAFALAAVLRAPARRAAALLALAPLVYVGEGAHLEGFQPVSRQLHRHARTEDVRRRDGTVGMRGSIVLGDVDVPADECAVLGLRSTYANEPLRVRRYDQLLERELDPRGELGVVSHASRHALDLFGVECVLDADGWVDVDTTLAGAPARRAAWRETEELLPGSGVTTYFTSPADGPQALRFPWITHGAPNASTLTVTVDDLDTGQRLVDEVFAPGSVRPAGRRVLDCVLAFPRDARTKGHALALRVRSGEDAVAGRSFALGCRTDVAGSLPGLRSTQGERVLEAPLALDVSYARDAFVRQDRVGPFELFRVEGGTPRFRTLGTARVVPDDRAAWESVLDPAFDPRVAVVLEQAPADIARAGAPADEAGAQVDVLDDVDGRVRLVVRRRTDGFVVTPIPWYPGWRARVNGSAAPVLCANYAFTAVAVPHGESLLELDYAPKSVRNGVVLSILGLVALLVAFASTVPPERARRELA